MRSFEAHYKHGSSRYRLTVENPHGVSRGIVKATLDGGEISSMPCQIPLVNDGRFHVGLITLG